MIKKFTHVTVLAKDIDEALHFYTNQLGLKKHTDVTMPDGFRWTTVCAQGQEDFELVLTQASTDQERAMIGAASSVGGLETDDCRKTFAELKKRGVKFIGEPVEEVWGVGVMFEDLYGNKFYLNQPKH